MNIEDKAKEWAFAQSKKRGWVKKLEPFVITASVNFVILSIAIFIVPKPYVSIGQLLFWNLIALFVIGVIYGILKGREDKDKAKEEFMQRWEEEKRKQGTT